MNLKIKYEICGGNCRIIDGWKYKDRKVMEEFVQDHLTAEPFNCRSVASYIREWRAHNLLYKWNIKVESTKDVDLDIKETWLRRFGYFILSIIYSIVQ